MCCCWTPGRGLARAQIRSEKNLAESIEKSTRKIATIVATALSEINYRFRFADSLKKVVFNAKYVRKQLFPSSNPAAQPLPSIPRASRRLGGKSTANIRELWQGGERAESIGKMDLGKHKDVVYAQIEATE